MQPARKRAARHPAGIIRFIIIPEQLNQNGIYRCSGTDRMMFVSAILALPEINASVAR